MNILWKRMKMDSVKTLLYNNPSAGLGTSLGGFLISLTDILPPFLRFLILLFSTITAISMAYIQYSKALGVYYEKKSRKKGSRNTR